MTAAGDAYDEAHERQGREYEYPIQSTASAPDDADTDSIVPGPHSDGACGLERDAALDMNSSESDPNNDNNVNKTRRKENNCAILTKAEEDNIGMVDY